MNLLVPPPLVALICVVSMWYLSIQFPAAGFDFPLRVPLALVVCVVGAGLDFSALRLFLKNKTTISPVAPQKSEALVTDGIYRFTRNPMYLGMSLLITAIGLWLGTAFVVAAIVVFVLYITRYQIIPEEEILMSKFGRAYADYCARVRRWI